MSGHEALETARDALFWEHLAADRLAVVYLAVAFVSIAVGLIHSRLSPRPKSMVPLLALTSVVTIGIWLLVADAGAIVACSLYVWSAAAALVTMIRFWGLLGKSFDVSQAKRVFPAIGSAAIAGALLGSAGAAAEIMFIPLADSERSSARTLVDLQSHRGAQAIGSIFLIVLASQTANDGYLGWLIAGSRAVAAAFAFRSRELYQLLFSRMLKRTAARPIAFPELDVASLESLVSALGSPDEEKVRAALMLLAERGRMNAVLLLIFYHPSPDVLALENFTASDRTDYLEHAGNRLDHEYATVRAAALRARMWLSPNEDEIRARLEVTCPVVHATALVGLASNFVVDRTEIEPRIVRILETGSPVAREALARAIRFGPSMRSKDALLMLSESSDDSVVVSVVETIEQVQDPVFIPTLIQLQGRRCTRLVATLALSDSG